jgi:DNA polymerase III alpha subunit|tara:strand:- start:1421 stop:1654 length:234 start_codon:yes stop_codon:yes gene_type:complete
MSIVTVNLAKAKTITKDRLRAERIPLLEAQDISYMKAQEVGADTSAIVAEKQRLRDITKTVDSCKTLAQLSALSCKN